MLKEYTGSEIMEKAARYARNARRHLFEEEACSSLEASPIFRRFMEDDDLQELVHIDGFDSDTGDFLDSLDGVRLALHNLDMAAMNLAARVGSEMGQKLTEEHLEKWESSCQIEVITRSGARLTVDIQQNGSFEKLECVFKSELPNRLEVFRPIFDTFTAYIMDRFPEAVSQPRWE